MDRVRKRDRLRAFLKSDSGKRLSGWVRRAFMAGILVFLAMQFTRVGWREIWLSLPTEGLFYLIFVLLYCALPLTEAFIYSRILSIGFLEGLPFFFKKRVFNKDVLSYSGEVYFFLWADKRIEKPRNEVIHAIKDNNIVSAVSSTFFVVCLLGYFFFTGQVEFPANYSENLVFKIGAGLVLIAFIMGAGIRFRKSVFALPGRTLLWVFGTHFGRLAAVSFLQVLQWSIVLPDVRLEVLFTLLSMQIIASRIPLLPARDLVFLGAAVEMTAVLDVSTAEVAGMLAVVSVLDKFINLVLFSAVSLFERESKSDDSFPRAIADGRVTPDP